MPCSQPHAANLRIGRYSNTGCVYFLTSTVAHRRAIFENKRHAEFMLSAIRWLHNEHRFAVDAAVVMPDHIHIVGQLIEGSLAKVMHSVKSYTAKRLVAAGVEPPVWQAGYYDHGLRKDENYNMSVKYVIENPVRAGIVQQLENYPYLILPDWWSISLE